MKEKTMNEKFASGSTKNLSVEHLANFAKNAIDAKGDIRESDKEYLVIPPIQRGLVWRNEQIINYWDSLFRGFPPGMMLYYKEPAESGKSATNANNQKMNIKKDDLHLFDGQQRLNAILLGFGYLEDADKKLWIDLGKLNDDGLPIFRINSIGQPFGYKTDKPNERFEISKRREKNIAFKDKKLSEIFKKVKNDDIIDANCCIELSCFLMFVLNEPDDKLVLDRVVHAAKKAVDSEEILKLINKTRLALNATIIFHYPEFLKPEKLKDNSNDMLLFFERVGRGGTALSAEEQIYSKIKFHYPIIREKMTIIMKPFNQGGFGRIIGETDLVMSALRVSFAIDSKRKFLRPVPNDFKNIEIKNAENNEYSTFKELLNEEGNTFLYLDILRKLRNKLEFCNNNNNGLPVILLSKLDKHLIDVLVLIGYKIEKSKKWGSDELSETLISFVLYWLVFHKGGKQKNMADIAYKFIYDYSDNFTFNQEFLKKFIAEFTEEVAFPLNYLKEIEEHNLNQPENFKLDKIKNSRDWKHFLSYNGEKLAENQNLNFIYDFLYDITYNGNEKKRNILLWLERVYLFKHFENYDSTSDFDEELPIDLDHIIPQSRWSGKHMGKIQSNLSSDKYKYILTVVGNSIGNFKYLSFSDNRGRNDAELTHEYLDEHKIVKHIDDSEKWLGVDKHLNKWGENETGKSDDKNLETFKTIIAERSFNLLEEFFSKSGISKIQLEEKGNDIP